MFWRVELCYVVNGVVGLLGRFMVVDGSSLVAVGWLGNVNGVF